MPCPISLSEVRHTSSTKHCALPRLSPSLSSQAHFQHQALCPALCLSLSQQLGTLPAPSTVPCPISLPLSAVRHTSSTKHCALPSLSLFRWSGTLPAPTASYFLSPGCLSSLMKTGWTVAWDDIVLQQLLSLYWKDNYEKLENKYNTKRMTGSCGYNSQRAVLSYMYMVSL